MRDLIRLRDQLYAVVLATPLLASCSGSPPRPGPEVRVALDAAPEPPPPDAGPPDAPRAVLAPLHEPWPSDPGFCEGGTWCGTIAEAEPHSEGQRMNLNCSVHLYDAPLDFTLDEEATLARRERNDLETCCYDWYHYCPGGRPYGAPVIAGATLAERWLAAAQTEHASVASFARASLELMAVGAPPALIAGCHRAALDELRHASACLAIATRLAGRALALSPVPALPPRGGGLVRVALDTFVEGCVAETHGALVAQRALDGCTDPDAARALRRIARDEARHAELAWQIVAWTLEVGGTPVRAALASLHGGLVPPQSGAADPSLTGSGQLDDAAVGAAAREAWREIIAPLAARMIG